MEFKKCNGCLQVKNVSEFGKEARAKNGYKPRCKECYNADYNSRYYIFKDKKLTTCKVRYESKKDELKQLSKDRYYQNREVKLAYRIKLAYRKKYATDNKDKIQVLNRKYHQDNKDANLFYRTSRLYRRFLHRLKIEKNGLKTSELLGYTYTELIKRLGREPNIDEAIDHKIPVSWFTDFCDAKLINHLDNLQILTKVDNSKKLNSFCHSVSREYFELIKDKIKPKYLTKITHYGN